MKAIDSKNLIKAMKDGKTEKKQISMTKKPPLNVDDREPMERVADELINFAEVIQSMNKSQLDEINKIVEVIQTMNRSQADEVTKLLKLVLAAIEKIGQIKQPLPLVKESEKLTSINTRPREWELIPIRDSNGLINKIKVVAGEK
jgi:hypothetical protein